MLELRADRYCALLEQQLWRTYRRGASSYTPLLIPLPGSKEPSKSAVEEPLRECGLSSLLAALEGGGRRWLIILDGYDEVQGNTNFIVGNKLSDMVGVKVSHRGRVWGSNVACRGCFVGDTASGTPVKIVRVQVAVPPCIRVPY